MSDTVLDITKQWFTRTICRETALDLIRRHLKVGLADAETYFDAAYQIILDDRANALEEELKSMRYEVTDPRTSTRWSIQPTRRTGGASSVSNFALIIAENYNAPNEIDSYEPVGLASGLSEAIAIIASDHLDRRPEKDDLPVEVYSIWNRDPHGKYCRDATIRYIPQNPA